MMNEENMCNKIFQRLQQRKNGHLQRNMNQNGIRLLISNLDNEEK